MRRAQLFGKLPAHGDFVSRGLDAGERDALDAWLSASLADARERLGGQFEDAYALAPAWRFAGAGMAGALAVSMDRSGRHFPLWLALGGVPEEEARAVARSGEDLLHRALAEGWDADSLLERAERLEPAAGPSAELGWWIEDAAGAAVAHIAVARPADLVYRMLTVLEEVLG